MKKFARGFLKVMVKSIEATDCGRILLTFKDMFV